MQTDEMEIYKLIQEILPEVQQDIHKQLIGNIEHQYQQKLQKQLSNLQKNIEDQYNQAKEALNKELNALKQEQIRELQAQMHQIAKTQEEKYILQVSALQEAYLNDNFNRVLEHPEIKAIEEEMENQIMQRNIKQNQRERERKIKSMMIKMENKEIRDRKELEKGIKNRVERENGLEELQKNIGMLRIGIGAMKSQYNIKMFNIDNEIRQTKLKMKGKGTQKQLREFKAKYEQMTKLQQRRHNKQNQYIAANIPNSRDQLQGNSLKLREDQLITLDKGTQDRGTNNFSSLLHHNGVFESTQYVNEDIESDQSMEEESTLMEPPYYNIVETIEEEDVKDIKKPILNVNVVQMLRQKWNKDPLESYISHDQHESAITNNFKNIYELYLKKLNSKSQIKSTKMGKITKYL